MRKLMLFTIGFTAACCLGVYCLDLEYVSQLVAASFAAAVLLFCFRKKLKGSKWASLVFLGCALGFLWYAGFWTHVLEPASRLNGQTCSVTFRTSDYGVRGDFGTEAEATLCIQNRRYKARLYLDSLDPVSPGMEITGRFRFIFTAPQEDPVSWESGNGIFLVAYQKDEVTITAAEEPLWTDKIAVLRQFLRNALRSSFPQDAYPFAQALLLGDTSALDYQTDTDFKISGIRHVIAVSGLHVSILIAMLAAVTFRKKVLMVPLGLSVLLIFAALAGFSPSVVRACLMSALLLLGILFNREYDGATALSFAVLVMLLCNPLVIAAVGFQLSVASVAGIFLFSDRIKTWILFRYDPYRKKHPIPGYVRIFAFSASATLGAMVLTTPLCAFYFGMVSLVGVVTNLLVLWIVSGIFYGIMAVCLLYALLPGFAPFLGAVIAWPIRYVLFAAGLMADLPLAAVYTDSIYIVFWLIFVYVLLAVFYFGKWGSPGQMFCCGTLGLCVALALSWMEVPSGKTVLTVLDVGQGQCVLLHSEGRTYMVDCGGYTDAYGADQAAGYLLSRGIRRLDGLILTHLDDDHAGGVEELQTRVETDLLILPPEHSELSAKNTVYAQQDLILEYENTSIKIFTPTFPGTANEKSLCVLFETENCAILITGDRDGFGERMLLRNAHIPDIDILIAGHHGSANSTCEELLSAVHPELVCISAGRNNLFGHPAPELLERLEKFRCTVYRTDKHGTITIRR